MKYSRFFKNLFLALPLFGLLAACGASQAPQSDPGVEDIAPGQKSVITAPERQPARDRLEERNI